MEYLEKRNEMYKNKERENANHIKKIEKNEKERSHPKDERKDIRTESKKDDEMENHNGGTRSRLVNNDKNRLGNQQKALLQAICNSNEESEDRLQKALHDKDWLKGTQELGEEMKKRDDERRNKWEINNKDEKGKTEEKMKNKCYRCQSSKHQTKECEKNENRCQICKKPGHVTEDCWHKKEKRCPICKKFGHEKEECWFWEKEELDEQKVIKEGKDRRNGEEIRKEVNEEVEEEEGNTLEQKNLQVLIQLIKFVQQLNQH